MSINNKNISEIQTNRFLNYVAAKTQYLESSDLPAVEHMHGECYAYCKALLKELDQKQESWNSTLQYQDFISKEFLELTSYSEKAREAMNVFTDTLINRFPHAKIDYGSCCVGPREDWTTGELKRNPFVELSETFTPKRKIRGDGNCFYTAFTTCYLEMLCQEKRFTQALSDILDGGRNVPGIESVKETLLQLEANHSRENLEVILNNNQKILPFVKYFRNRAAKYVKGHVSDFKNFGIGNAQEFCKNQIEKMGTYADHIAIFALCRSMNFPLLIVDIVGQKPVNTPFLLDAKEAQATFCRDGQHYFVIYPKNTKPQNTQALHCSRLDNQCLQLSAAYRENDGKKVISFFYSSAEGDQLPIETQMDIKKEIWEFNGSPLDKGSDFAGDLIKKNPFSEQVQIPLEKVVFAKLTQSLEKLLKSVPEVDPNWFFANLPQKLRENIKRGLWIYEGMPEGDGDFGNTFFHQSPRSPSVFKTITMLINLQGKLFSHETLEELHLLRNALILRDKDKIIEIFFKARSETQELIKKSIWKLSGSPMDQGADFGGSVLRNRPLDPLLEKVINQLIKNI